MLHAAEAAVTRATSHRDLAKAGVDAKLRPPIDLTREEADLQHFEVDRVRAQGALTAAQAVLAAAIGAPDAAIDTGADDVTYPSAPAFETLVRDLDRQDPSLRGARDVLDGQHALTHAIEREKLPDVSLSAGVTGRAGGATIATAGADNPSGAGFIPEVPNWDAMVVVSWPLFDRTVDVRAETSRRLEHVRVAELDAERERLRAAAKTVRRSAGRAERVAGAAALARRRRREQGRPRRGSRTASRPRSSSPTPRRAAPTRRSSSRSASSSCRAHGRGSRAAGRSP